jgi:hypothetical protein
MMVIQRRQKNIITLGVLIGSYVLVNHASALILEIVVISHQIFRSFFICDIPNKVDTFFGLTVRNFKGIIFCCIAALFIAELAIHRFDPFHPRSITSECIQTTVTPCGKTGWLAIAALLASLFLYKKHTFKVEEVLLNKPPAVALGNTLLYDPIRQALRRGRLRRLTYH